MTSRRPDRYFVAIVAAASFGAGACGDDASSGGPCREGGCDTGVTDQADAHVGRGPEKADAAPDSASESADAAALDSAAPAADGAAVDASPMDAAYADADNDSGADPDAASTDCDAPIQCPAPSAAHVTLCGQIGDIGGGDPIRDAVPSGSTCNPGAPTADGPCALTVRFYDALDFAADPIGATPLTADEVVVDDCGRYRGVNVVRPSTGFVAVVLDDAGAADVRVPTVTAFIAASGAALSGASVRATRRTTDEAWTTSSGLGPTTFAQQGVYLAVFLHGAAPVAGVQITRNGSVATADDFYFADADSGDSHTSIDVAKNSTGPNGSALIVGSGTPAAHGGSGGEPSGCEWPSASAAAIPGVVWYGEHRSQVIGDPSTPCP